MDLVSVIIPYYKKRNFIKETIVSVIKQSYDHLEIIIIYDDTNLNDLEFLKEISKIDNRIKIINNNNRLGAGPSRNKGIEQSNVTILFDFGWENEIALACKACPLNSFNIGVVV